MHKTNKNTYLIGEIGQNHNGSCQIAKQIIDLAVAPVKEELFNLSLKGMDAIKLTKRDLEYELSFSEMKRVYASPHSFGYTYGEHRKSLELSEEEHFELYTYSKKLGLDFIETLCAPTCLSLLKYFIPDKLKVASRDLTNLPLLAALAETKIPIILSTGMAGKKELDEALELITKSHTDISILHCVSEYPTQPHNVNLNSIKYLKNNYKEYQIGYSDHTIGISVPVAAVALGAEIIEKHITIDRSMKGTDQAGSLGKDGVRRMIRDIRLMEMAMGKEDIFIDPCVEMVKQKLERSCAVIRGMEPGDIIKESDLILLSPGTGFSWKERKQLIGKKLLAKVEKHEIILPHFIS